MIRLVVPTTGIKKSLFQTYYTTNIRDKNYKLLAYQKKPILILESYKLGYDQYRHLYNRLFIEIKISLYKCIKTLTLR